MYNVHQLQMTQSGQYAFRFEIFDTIYSYNNETYHTLGFSSYYEICL